MGSIHMGGCNDFRSFWLIDELCTSNEETIDLFVLSTTGIVGRTLTG